MANPGKEKKKEAVKDDIAAMLRRLSDEVVALRTDVEAVRVAHKDVAPALLPAPVTPSPKERIATYSPLTLADDGELARLGYAFSSVPKVALLRHLFQEEELSAAELGERAVLTTGSLYHHLRELIHAGVAIQSSRNRYALTEMGRRAMVALNGVVGGS